MMDPWPAPDAAGDQRFLTRWELAGSILETHQRHPSVPTHQLGEEVCLAAVDLVRALQPGAILELGSGRSTVALARAMRERGSGAFWSLEHDREYFEQTRATLEAQGLAPFVRLVHAPVRLQRRGLFVGLWYDLRALPAGPPFDLVLIDGPPARSVGRFMALPLLWDRLSDGAVLLLDDAKRKRLERRWVALWRRVYGPGLMGESYEGFPKGLALLMKTPVRAGPLTLPTVLDYLGHQGRHLVRVLRSRAFPERW